jgi:STE24 endopeptidase
MHLQIVIAFALLIWWPRESPFAPVVQSPAAVWITVATMLVVVAATARLASLSVLATLRKDESATQRPHRRHQRSLAALNGVNLAAFAAVLILTRWAEMIKQTPVTAVPGLADLIVISPYLVASVLILVLAYPADRALRERVASSLTARGTTTHRTWSLCGYLNFNVRHQMLMVLVPLTVILIVHDAAVRVEPEIEAATGIPWSADAALGIAAAGVFVVAPWMLRYIWTTSSMPPGPLRRELESFCRRVRLKCRDILVWHSHGIIANAAVMGIAGPVRYVVLSDGLIEAMSLKQIEAVFGHEAGHVRHKHIQFFLLFAMASMLVTSGVMEWLFHQWTVASLTEEDRQFLIQVMGLVTIVLIWGLGFGFISRRFEQQADLFGARCVAAANDHECTSPCGVHPGCPDAWNAKQRALCATGVEIFVSALERVAMLNGISKRESSWRHASIDKRIQALRAMAADPRRLAAFERLARRIRIVLLVVCIGGLLIAALYVGPYLIDAWSRSR